MSIVSIDLARRLKGAGLTWEPQVGDWCIELPVVDGSVPRLIVDMDDFFITAWWPEHGRSQIVDSLPGTYLLWLPTADQCLQALAEMRLDLTIAREIPATEDRHAPWEWHVKAFSLRVEQAQHADLAEAAGLVVAKVLEGHEGR